LLFDSQLSHYIKLVAFGIKKVALNIKIVTFSIKKVAFTFSKVHNKANSGTPKKT